MNEKKKKREKKHELLLKFYVKNEHMNLFHGFYFFIDIFFHDFPKMKHCSLKINELIHLLKQEFFFLFNSMPAKNTSV